MRGGGPPSTQTVTHTRRDREETHRSHTRSVCGVSKDTCQGQSHTGQGQRTDTGGNCQRTDAGGVITLTVSRKRGLIRMYPFLPAG